MQVGVAGFAWPGFAAFLFSVLLEALRVVYIQLLLGRLQYSSMEASGAPTLCWPCSTRFPQPAWLCIQLTS